MYKEYFGLKEAPFSIAPDPRYLYMSDKHREALAHLLYGVNSNGGFVLLTGEVGTGKTTICRSLLEQMPANTDIAFIINPKLTSEELLAAICDELEIAYPRDISGTKVLVDRINSYLLSAHARGRKTVLILEEAQNLGTDVLEQIRLLTNLETNQEKLLQIIMLGQPELRETLSRPEMRQLSQRVTARYHLGPLSKSEISGYVAHRLSVAGGHGTLFPPRTVSKLFSLSRGIPRLVNLICDRALLGAYAQGKTIVERATLISAFKQVSGIGEKAPFNGSRRIYALLLFALCGVALSLLYFNNSRQPEELAVAKQVPIENSETQFPKQSKSQAYESLFRTWGIPFTNRENPCDQARSFGLACFEGRGSIGKLMQLNRPAILRLLDPKGSDYYAALISLSGRKATFVVGNETKTVDVAEIESRWMGDYFLLWETPPNSSGSIRPGARGPEVRWLDKVLASANGRPPLPGKDLVYGGSMISEVKQFQKESGLAPDGIVGPRTIISLNAKSSGAGPKLSASRQEAD